MRRRLGPLVKKELRQVRRSRGALLSSTLLPLLLLIVTPAIQYYSLIVVAPRESLRASGTALLGGTDDPKLIFGQLLLPLFVALAGLVVPSVAATYTVVGERERRSLDLLIALPVRVSDILWAKLLAVLILAGVVVLPMFLVDAIVFVALGMINAGLAAGMLLLLISALAYSAGAALLVALLARDLRTAQNLNGALLVPVVAISSALLFGLPSEIRFLGLTALYLVAAAIAVGVGLRWLTFERYLQ